MSPALEIRELSKSFGAVRAVEAVSLTLEPGETVALLGPNGGGKTTTLRCAAGLLRPDSGTVRLAGGLDLRRDFKPARRSFTFLPQEASFPSNLTVREVMTLHARLRRLPATRIDAALAEAGLTAADAGKRVGDLSVGMRHRLSLAVAGLPEVPLMLLDEPTASLDPQGAIGFRELAWRWQEQGRAILFSTHVLSDVHELADRVVVLVAGRPVIEESLSDLRTRLSHRAVLRVEVGRPLPAHVDAALEAGASEARLGTAAVVIHAPPELRHRILQRLAALGPIEGFETEEPSLEQVYLDAVGSGGEVEG